MNKNRQRVQDDNVHTLLFGLIAGGLIGAGAALLLSPKRGHELRKDLYNAYENIAEAAAEKGGEIYENAAEWAAPRRKKTNKTVLLGGLTGGILGIATAYLLAQKSRKNFSEAFYEKTHEYADTIREVLPEDFVHSAGGWVKQAKNFLNTVDHALNNGSTIASKKTVSQSFDIQDVVEFANLGLRLYNNFKQGR